jgi:hypothetical protein
MATRWPGLLLLALLGGGCGGSSKPAPQALTDQPGEGATEQGEDSTGAPPDAAGNPGAPLDENECTQLADHLVDLSLAARRGKPAGAPNEVYTDEDAEAAKRELRQALKPACPTVPRRDFRCAMAAHTSAELGACQQ